MAQVEKYNIMSAMAIIAHCERTCDNHSNKNINPEKTKDNYSLFPSGGPDPIGGRKAFARLRQRLNQVSVLNRSDVNVLCDWCIHLGVDVMPGHENEKEFFEACYRYVSNLYGAENIVYAWVHMDEETPHIHVGFVPIVKKKIKIRKNCNPKKKADLEEKIAAGQDTVQRVDADAIITLKHLQGWHPAFSAYMIEQLGYDPAVHTGITQALGGNLSVKQLKKKPADWREKRNKQAEAFHEVRRAAKENRPSSLDARIDVKTPGPKAQAQQETKNPGGIDALIQGAIDRAGHPGR